MRDEHSVGGCRTSITGSSSKFYFQFLEESLQDMPKFCDHFFCASLVSSLSLLRRDSLDWK